MDSLPVQTAFCLSVVLDGIAMSVKTLTSLKKSLAFRAVELSLRPVPSGAHPRTFRGADCLAAHGRDRGRVAAHTTGTRSRSDREADGGYPSAFGHGGNRASAGGGGPTGMSATARYWACTSASASGSDSRGEEVAPL